MITVFIFFAFIQLLCNRSEITECRRAEKASVTQSVIALK